MPLSKLLVFGEMSVLGATVLVLLKHMFVSSLVFYCLVRIMQRIISMTRSTTQAMEKRTRKTVQVV